MDIKHESPVIVVDNAVTQLWQLAALCNIMMFVDPRFSEVDSDIIASAMAHLWECLDAQIKALNSVEWPKGGGAV